MDANILISVGMQQQFVMVLIGINCMRTLNSETLAPNGKASNVMPY